MEVTKENPVFHRRTGYHRSGYAFHFVRCLDRKTLREYVRKIPGVKYEPWFDGPAEDIPEAFTVCTSQTVLPGLIPESVPDPSGVKDSEFLCEIFMCVTARFEDARMEKRHWFHEIGHAVSFAQDAYPTVHGIGTYQAYVNGGLGFRESLAILLPEFPAYCNEYLCETLDQLFTGGDYTVASGFPFLFPWLNKGEAE